MSAEFEQLVAEYEKFQSKIKNVDDRFANIGDLRDELTQLEVSAVSPDRAVTVVAGPGGSIKDIRFTEAALSRRPEALSAALMSTLQQAVAESARRQASLVEGHLGDGLHLVDQVLEAQSELFGIPVDELREKMPEKAPAEHGDDFAERSVLAEEPPPAPPPAATGGSQGDQFLKNLFDEEDR
ncbi:YbaB/EbfC family nucleoid-associated protein [Amycolatopsis nigrescens]|uniref:YbaB/EbfC family nucleoid-associated protein n=1 Tax=Amycolatopsis nigrescens TaxID=381445 RepID=UPI0004775306|nr:YbaB/EbfC family nucleoid-associated protein [Amycolatopsis nigrescens]